MNAVDTLCVMMKNENIIIINDALSIKSKNEIERKCVYCSGTPKDVSIILDNARCVQPETQHS